MEDVIYACYRSALRTELTEGKADVCKNDDKRKDNPGNILTSIAATIGISNEETQSLGEGSQPDGVTVYGLYLEEVIGELLMDHLPIDSWPSETVDIMNLTIDLATQSALPSS